MLSYFTERRGEKPTEPLPCLLDADDQQQQEPEMSATDDVWMDQPSAEPTDSPFDGTEQQQQQQQPDVDDDLQEQQQQHQPIEMMADNVDPRKIRKEKVKLNTRKYRSNMTDAQKDEAKRKDRDRKRMKNNQ